MAGCYADASSHQPLRMFWLPVFKWSLYRCMFKIPSVESDREPGVRSSSQESYCSYLASHHWGWEIRTTIPFRNTACPVVSWNSNFLPFVTSSLHQSCASHLVVIQFFLMKENKIKRLCLLFTHCFLKHCIVKAKQWAVLSLLLFSASLILKAWCCPLLVLVLASSLKLQRHRLLSLSLCFSFLSSRGVVEPPTSPKLFFTLVDYLAWECSNCFLK